MRTRCGYRFWPVPLTIRSQDICPKRFALDQNIFGIAHSFPCPRPPPTAYCPLATAFCPLLTAHCSPPTGHCLLPTAHRPLLAAHCPLLPAPCSLLPARAVDAFRGDRYIINGSNRVVGVAQLVRVPDCGSGCRRFKSGHPPLASIIRVSGTREVILLFFAFDLPSWVQIAFATSCRAYEGNCGENAA